MSRQIRKQKLNPDQVAGSLLGKLLAEAFVVSRRQGFILAVSKLDGVPQRPDWPGKQKEIIDVDVVRGLVAGARCRRNN